jgi:cbb3-type cytochrome oxidase subunit 3
METKDPQTVRGKIRKKISDTGTWVYLLLIFVSILILAVFALLDVKRFASIPANNVTLFNSIIATLVVLVFIIFFVFFIPVLYLLFIKNKREKIEEDIRLLLEQANPKSVKDFENKFIEEYGDAQYKIPVILATILIFFGFLLLFFPNGLPGFEYHLNRNLSSYIGSIADSSPAITYGFIGAYFFSIQLVFRRYLQSDLKPQVFMFVTMRILIVLILTFVISLLFEGDIFTAHYNYALVFSFLIGIFPQVGLTYIENNVGKIFGIERFGSKSTPLQTIQGLTLWHEVRLLEEDIENVQNLATADIEKLLIATHDQRVIDWIDQALLLIHVGDGNIDKWRATGIRTATDLLDFLIGGENRAKVVKAVKSNFTEEKIENILSLNEENKAKVAKALGSDYTEEKIEIIFHSLKRDPNMEYVYPFWKNIAGKKA